MKIVFHRRFERQYKKLSEKIKKKVKERNVVFADDPLHPSLGNHPLKGKYVGHRSINVSGDIRIIYKFINIDTALFLEIGTHSDLYK